MMRIGYGFRYCRHRRLLESVLPFRFKKNRCAYEKTQQNPDNKKLEKLDFFYQKNDNKGADRKPDDREVGGGGGRTRNDFLRSFNKNQSNPEKPRNNKNLENPPNPEKTL
jgi:hypothetical protein